MQIEQLQYEFERVQADLADGPILPSVTVEEIRSHLASRYHFQKELPLDEVAQDAERMLRTWQVQVSHPRYLGLFNPAVTLPSVIAETLVAMYNPQLANWRTWRRRLSTSSLSRRSVFTVRTARRPIPVMCAILLNP